MNIDKLREELAADEGCVYEIYLDHLGLPTFGIGHLVTENDQEHGQEVGTPVSEERVQDVFAKDIVVTLDECETLYEGFSELPEEVQLICANMMFNLGRTRFQKFVRFRAAVVEGDWAAAADEMQDSLWSRQVPNRASRLISRMRDLAV